MFAEMQGKEVFDCLSVRKCPCKSSGKPGKIGGIERKLGQVSLFQNLKTMAGHRTLALTNLSATESSQS